jgi:hypothetical protein
MNVRYLEPQMSSNCDFYNFPSFDDVDAVPRSECCLLTTPSNVDRERKYGFLFDFNNLLYAQKILSI